jgi:diguanylate cyclase (GGDEF)-like protein
MWDRTLVLVSLLLGALLSIAALYEHRRMRRAIPWSAAGLLTLAICSLHFVAMAAAGIYPDAGIEVPVEAIEGNALAVAVTATALLILTISFAVVLFDRRIARAQIDEALRTKALADAVIEGAAEREQLHVELRRQAEISSAALENMVQGLSMFDSDDRLVTFNQRWVEIYEMPPELARPGIHIQDILVHQEWLTQDPTTLEKYLHLTRIAKFAPSQAEAKLRSGRIIEIRRRPLADGGWLATHDDITERREADGRIAYLASHDALTGLPNRVTFGDRLQAASRRLARGESFALHSIDLDRFKEVNDTLGHPVGDQILKQVAARLTQIVREDDLVTRLAGDEFAILQPNKGSGEDAASLATRVIAALEEPFEFDGHTIAIGATIGIALAPSDGKDADDLLKKSDLALYRAKAEGRGTFRFFEPGMDALLRKRREMESELRVAVQSGQFLLHYQPILKLDSQTILGFEALVRWNHPTRGQLPPGEFIPTAEETGLIIPVGEWVLRQACKDAVGWPEAVAVSVNLSPAQFKRGDLLAMVTSALAASGLAPERLELEITESVLLHDESWVRIMLEQLQKLGVRIAMDDFGTGYSSLSYLRSFPFSKIKIDQGFISDITTRGDALAIVQATIQLSEKLGMRTTAEGVETPEQMEILLAEGCTEVQGYHVSRPVPIGEVDALLELYGALPPRKLKAAS